MIPIRLHRVFFPVTTLGFGQRLGVWVMGCTRNCPGCLSPEMQPTDTPSQPLQEILERLPLDLPCDGLTISGGEPFDQPEAVAALAQWFTDHYNDDILIYTGYTLQQLRDKQHPAVDRLLSLASAVVDAPYLAEQNHGIGLYCSSNQTLHIFRHAPRYRGFETAPRQVQCIAEHHRLVLIGIPPNETKHEYDKQTIANHLPGG